MTGWPDFDPEAVLPVEPIWAGADFGSSIPGEKREAARSSARTVPGAPPPFLPSGAPTIYGVRDPGFPKSWEPCSFVTDEACAEFFRRRCVPMDFGVPTRAVIWSDSRDNIRGAVAHYHNGKAAVLRFSSNGRWALSFEDVR